MNYLEVGFPGAQTHHPMALLPPSRNPPFANTQPPMPPQPVKPPPGVSAEHYLHGLPNGCPPGLVRVSPPFPTPIRTITNENVSLFSDFAHYLDRGRDEDGNPVVVDLTCLICLERKLQVPACVTANYPPGLEGPSFEWLTILPCRHYLGSECLENWLVESKWRSPDMAADCPLCRLKLEYHCGHFLPPREFNPVKTRAQQVPMTLPEGGMVPWSCPDCNHDDIREALDKVSDLLFPSTVVVGDLRHPDSGELLQRASFEFSRRMWRFTELEEHYHRW